LEVGGKTVFSSGVSTLSQITDMVFAGTKIGHLLISGDHPCPVEDNKIIRADQLTLNNKLVDKNNNLIAIDELLLVDYQGGIHHVGARHHTDILETGHCIRLNNFTTGDYTMQTKLGKIDPKEYTIFTPEYSLKNNHTNSKSASYNLPYKVKVMFPPEPLNAVPLLPRETIPKLHTTLPPTSNYHYEEVYFIKKVIESMFGIKVKINYDSSFANVYSLPNNEIEIHGGLIRHTALGFDGILCALISAISVYKAEPKRKDKPWASCAYDAAFYAGTYGFREVWYGQDALIKLKNGAMELEKFIKYGVDIKEKVHNSCEYFAPSCRTEVLLSGLDFGDIPKCIKY